MDLSIAEKLARHTAAVDSNLGSATKNAKQLNVILQTMVGHSNNVARNLNQAVANMGKGNQEAQRMAQNLNNSQQASSKLGTILGGIAAGATLLGLELSRTYSMLNKIGFGPAMSVKRTFDAIGTSVKNFDLAASFSESAAASAGLTENLGSSQLVSDSLVRSALELTSLYGVSNEVATKLASTIYRWSDGSNATVKSTLAYTTALAKANGIAPGDLYADIAKNSELIAQYGAQGFENFAKMAVAAKQGGFELKSMAGVADKLVNDFEGTLTMTAKLQTVLPGFNSSGIMYASQFGSEEDVGNAVRDALKGAGLNDLSQLPRSIRNMISSGLGLSKGEIENLLHPTGAQVQPPTAKDVDAAADKIVTGFITALKWAGAIGAGAGVGKFGLKNILPGIGGIISRMFNGAPPPPDLIANAAPTIEGFAGNAITGTEAATAGGAIAGGVAPAAEATAAAGSTGILSSIAGFGATLLRFIPPILIITSIIGGVVGFIKSITDGNGFWESVGNALTGALTLGLWRPFGKLKDTTEDLAKAQQQAAKHTMALNAAMDDAGVINKQFALGISGVSQTTAVPDVTNMHVLQSLQSMDKPLGGRMPEGYDAYADGGEVSTDSLALLHKNEMVLPVTLADTIRKMAAVTANVMSVGAGGGTDMSAVEAKLNELIQLFKSGGIQVNLDGRKISSGLMEANRYG